jgi:hypothetical protein
MITQKDLIPFLQSSIPHKEIIMSTKINTSQDYNHTISSCLKSQSTIDQYTYTYRYLCSHQDESLDSLIQNLLDDGIPKFTIIQAIHAYILQS